MTLSVIRVWSSTMLVLMLPSVAFAWCTPWQYTMHSYLHSPHFYLRDVVLVGLLGMACGALLPERLRLRIVAIALGCLWTVSASQVLRDVGWLPPPAPLLC